MNLSQNDTTPLFASFSASFNAASWPTCPSMSCEAALKSAKKIHQKSKFSHLGIGS
jgi:hypothetical protein